MKAVHEETIRTFYRHFSVNHIIQECNNIVHNIEPEELDRRVIKLIAHVTETYNSEMFAFSFEDIRSSRIKNTDYSASSSYNMFVGNRQTHIMSYGSDKDVIHLISILHEIGHGIDFKKRPNPKSFMTRDCEGIAKKEIRAWIYGLRLGYLIGIVSKKEIDENYSRCMLCLASYLKDFGWNEDNFIDIAKEIYKKVFE